MIGSKGDERVWGLYQHAWEEEQYFLAEMHRRLVFFGSLLPALIGATIAGVLASTAWWHYLMLIVGPVVICGIAKTAADAMRRSHRRVLEAIALRAKAEHDLGLTEARSDDESKMWYEREAFVGLRHRAGRDGLSTVESVRDDLVVPFVPVAGATQLRISIERPSRELVRIVSSDHFVAGNLEIGVNATYARFLGVVQSISVVAIGGLVGLAMTKYLY